MLYRPHCNLLLVRGTCRWSVLSFVAGKILMCAALLVGRCHITVFRWHLILLSPPVCPWTVLHTDQVLRVSVLTTVPVISS